MKSETYIKILPTANVSPIWHNEIGVLNREPLHELMTPYQYEGTFCLHDIPVNLVLKPEEFEIITEE